MRTKFIRALAVAVLTTSLSAFAVTNESKPADPATPCANARQDDSSQATSNAKKDQKSKDQNKQQKEQEKDTGQFTGIWG